MIRFTPRLTADCRTSGADHIMNMILAIDRYSSFKDPWLKAWLQEELRMMTDPIAEDLDVLLEEIKDWVTEDTYYYVKGLILYGPLGK